MRTSAVASRKRVPASRFGALYENHCQVCHTQKVHTRPNRMILTAAEMREVVDRWQREENLRWSAQEIDDVVHFLGVTLYKFQ